MKQKINLKILTFLSYLTVTACSQQIEQNGVSNDEKGPKEIVNQLRNDSEYTEKLKTVEDDDLVKALEKANIENVKDIADVVIKEVNGADIKIISKSEIKKKTDIRRDRELKEFKVKSKIPVGRLKLVEIENTKPILFGSNVESKAFDILAKNEQNKESHISYSEVSNANLCRAFYNVNNLDSSIFKTIKSLFSTDKITSSENLDLSHFKENINQNIKTLLQDIDNDNQELLSLITDRFREVQNTIEQDRWIGYKEAIILLAKIKNNIKTELINRGYDPKSIEEDRMFDGKNFCYKVLDEKICKFTNIKTNKLRHIIENNTKYNGIALYNTWLYTLFEENDKDTITIYPKIDFYHTLYFYDYDDYMTLKKRMVSFLPQIDDEYKQNGEYAILNKYKSLNFEIFDLALNMLNNPIKHLNLCFETYDDSITHYTLSQNNEDLYLESLIHADALIKDFRKFQFSFLSAKDDFEKEKEQTEQELKQTEQELANNKNSCGLQLNLSGYTNEIKNINELLTGFEGEYLYFYHGLDIKFTDFLKNIYQVDLNGKFQQLLTPKYINKINYACYEHEHDKTDDFKSFVKKELGNFKGKVILNPAFCSTSFSKKEVIDQYLGHGTYPVFITIKIPKELLKKYPAKFFYIDKQDLKLSNGKGLIHNTEKEMLLTAGLKLKIKNIYGMNGKVNNHEGRNILAIEAEPYEK